MGWQRHGVATPWGMVGGNDAWPTLLEGVWEKAAHHGTTLAEYLEGEAITAKISEAAHYHTHRTTLLYHTCLVLRLPGANLTNTTLTEPHSPCATLA